MVAATAAPVVVHCCGLGRIINVGGMEEGTGGSLREGGGLGGWRGGRGGVGGGAVDASSR